MNEINSQLIGIAYVQKLDQALQPQEAFAAYDILTPDEPSPAWQFAKRLPGLLGNGLVSLRGETRYPHNESIPTT